MMDSRERFCMGQLPLGKSIGSDSLYDSTPFDSNETFRTYLLVVEVLRK